MNVDLRGAFWTPSATILSSASKMYDRIVRSIFANGEQGFAYDPNDLTTLFQDAAGTIPVTATGQPVGLVLDKSKGLKLGVELFNQFNSTLNSTLSQNTLPCVVTSTVSVGVFGVAATNIFQGGVHKIEFTWSGNSNQAEMGVQLPDGNNLSLGTGVTGSFSKVMNFISTGSFSITKAQPQVGQTFTVSAVSIKKIAGNHAYQTVSASRPIVQQSLLPAPELLTNSGFNTDTSTWTAYRSPIYSVSGGQLTIASSGTETGGLYQDISTEVGSTYSVNITKAGSVSLGVYGGAGFINTIITTFSSSFTFVATSTTTRVYIYCNVGNNGVVSDISVRKMTGYATDKNYLAFDGVDDFLQTNNIDFTVTDKVSLFAGMRKLSDTVAAIAVEFSGNANTNNGAFFLGAPRSVSQNIGFLTRGSAQTAADFNDVAAPHSTVVTAKMNISGDFTQLRERGRAATSNADLGTGNLGNYPLYIGRRNGTALPFNGNIYGLIGVGRLTTDGETLAVERELAKQTGVTLNV